MVQNDEKYSGYLDGRYAEGNKYKPGERTRRMLAKIAKHAVATGLTIREATIELGYVDGTKLTLAQLDKALDVLSMTRPG